LAVSGVVAGEWKWKQRAIERFDPAPITAGLTPCLTALFKGEIKWMKN